MAGQLAQVVMELQVSQTTPQLEQLLEPSSENSPLGHGLHSVASPKE